MTNKYFNFLCRIVGKADRYSILLGELSRLTFYPLIPNDDNRCEDGKQLRDRFCDEEGGQHALSLCPDGPCTVLEMLIGLSFRLEFETANSCWEKTPSDWFWILIDNLGLSKARHDPDRGGILRHAEIEDIRNRIEIFLERRYDDNGYGGLFPLARPKQDQREVEIWYQMSAYILENYPI